MAALDYDRLARFYDALVTGGEDVAFFVSRAREAGGKVLELMAGTGRVSLPVLQSGADLTCVDSSPAMLALLRAKLEAAGLGAPVHERDVSWLDLATRYSMAFIAYHSFEELVTDEERLRALERIRAHLVPGGAFVCTLHDPALRAAETGPGKDLTRTFTEPGTGRNVELRLRSSLDARTSIVSGEESFRDAETGEEILELPIRFRLSGSEEFAALAGSAGFEIESLHGGYAGGAYEAGKTPTMVWTLRRPGSL